MKNLHIDEQLLERAHNIGGLKSKTDTVNTALAEFVQNREQRSIVDLFGSVDFWPGFDHKRLRAKR